MGKTNVTDHATHGDVILERLASTKLTPALKTAAASFKKAHAAFVAASGDVAAAKATRDDALHAVGAADEALDAALGVLAAKMIGAQMGPRKNAFTSFSKYAPYDLTALAYADEVKEVTSLVAAVKKAKPAADVAKAAAQCGALASNVTKALAALTKPQLAYTKALAARDALLLSWTKALTVLKKTAAVAWIDDDATYKSVFAPPAKVQAPVKTRAKKTAAKAVTNGASSATAAPVAKAAPPAAS